LILVLKTSRYLGRPATFLKIQVNISRLVPISAIAGSLPRPVIADGVRHRSSFGLSEITSSHSVNYEPTSGADVSIAQSREASGAVEAIVEYLALP
jgi:hypothetical protein